MKQYKLYVLRDPRDNQIRYVGWTNNPKRRLKDHIHEASKNIPTKKNNWIKKLTKLSLKPIMEVFDSFDTAEEVKQAEIQSIKRHKILGYNLTNMTLGGDGIDSVTARLMGRTKKKIIDSNGNIYDSLTEASESLGIQMKLISKVLRGTMRQTGGITFDYYTEGCQTPVAREKKRNPGSKAVIDSYGNVFLSQRLAAKFHNVASESVRDHLHGKIKSVKGITFSYIKGDK